MPPALLFRTLPRLHACNALPDIQSSMSPRLHACSLPPELDASTSLGIPQRGPDLQSSMPPCSQHSQHACKVLGFIYLYLHASARLQAPELDTSASARLQ